MKTDAKLILLHNIDSALKKINHVPYITSKWKKMAVWSDIKEALFLWCANPKCSVVLKALKHQLGYPESDTSMHPCSQSEQLLFMEQFIVVTPGTLLVDLNVLRNKKGLMELYDMVKVKHDISRDLNVMLCNTMLSRISETYSQTSFKIPLKNITRKKFLPAIKRISKPIGNNRQITLTQTEGDKATKAITRSSSKTNAISCENASNKCYGKISNAHVTNESNGTGDRLVTRSASRSDSLMKAEKESKYVESVGSDSETLHETKELNDTANLVNMDNRTTITAERNTSIQTGGPVIHSVVYNMWDNEATRALVPLIMLREMYPACTGFLQSVVHAYMLGRSGGDNLRSVTQCMVEEGIQLNRFRSCHHGFDKPWPCLTTCSLMMSWSDFWRGYANSKDALKLLPQPVDVSVLTLVCQTGDIIPGNKNPTIDKGPLKAKKQIIETDSSEQLVETKTLEESLSEVNITDITPAKLNKLIEETKEKIRNMRTHIESEEHYPEMSNSSSLKSDRIHHSYEDESVYQENSTTSESSINNIKVSTNQNIKPMMNEDEKNRRQNIKSCQNAMSGSTNKTRIKQQNNTNDKNINEKKKNAYTEKRKKNLKKFSQNSEQSARENKYESNHSKDINKESKVRTDSNNSAMNEASCSDMNETGCGDIYARQTRENVVNSKTDKRNNIPNMNIKSMVAHKKDVKKSVSSSKVKKTESDKSVKRDITYPETFENPGIEVSITQKINLLQTEASSKEQVNSPDKVKMDWIADRVALKIAAAHIDEDLPAKLRIKSATPTPKSQPSSCTALMIEMKKSNEEETATETGHPALISVTAKKLELNAPAVTKPAQPNTSETFPYKAMRYQGGMVTNGYYTLPVPDLTQRNKSPEINAVNNEYPVIQGSPIKASQKSPAKNRTASKSACGYPEPVNRLPGKPRSANFTSSVQKQTNQNSYDPTEMEDISAEANCNKAEELTSDFMTERVTMWKEKAMYKVDPNARGRISKSADLVNRKEKKVVYRPTSSIYSHTFDERFTENHQSPSFKTALCAIYSRDRKTLSPKSAAIYQPQVKITQTPKQTFKLVSENGSLEDVSNYGASSSTTPDIYDDYARKPKIKLIKPDVTQLKLKPVSRPIPPANKAVPLSSTPPQPVIKRVTKPQPATMTSGGHLNHNRVGYTSSPVPPTLEQQFNKMYFTTGNTQQKYNHSDKQDTGQHNLPYSSQMRNLMNLNMQHNYLQEMRKGKNECNSNINTDCRMCQDQLHQTEHRRSHVPEFHRFDHKPKVIKSSTSLNSSASKESQTDMQSLLSEKMLLSLSLNSVSLSNGDQSSTNSSISFTKTPNPSGDPTKYPKVDGTVTEVGINRVSLLDKVSSFVEKNLDTPRISDSLENIENLKSIASINPFLKDVDRTEIRANVKEVCENPFSLLKPSQGRAKSAGTVKPKFTISPQPAKSTSNDEVAMVSKICSQLYFRLAGEKALQLVEGNVIIPHNAEFFVNCRNDENIFRPSVPPAQSEIIFNRPVGINVFANKLSKHKHDPNNKKQDFIDIPVAKDIDDTDSNEGEATKKTEELKDSLKPEQKQNVKKSFREVITEKREAKKTGQKGAGKGIWASAQLNKDKPFSSGQTKQKSPKIVKQKIKSGDLEPKQQVTKTLSEETSKKSTEFKSEKGQKKKKNSRSKLAYRRPKTSTCNVNKTKVNADNINIRPKTCSSVNRTTKDTNNGLTKSRFNVSPIRNDLPKESKSSKTTMMYDNSSLNKSKDYTGLRRLPPRTEKSAKQLPCKKSDEKNRKGLSNYSSDGSSMKIMSALRRIVVEKPPYNNEKGFTKSESRQRKLRVSVENQTTKKQIVPKIAKSTPKLINNKTTFLENLIDNDSDKDKNIVNTEEVNNGGILEEKTNSEGLEAKEQKLHTIDADFAVEKTESNIAKDSDIVSECNEHKDEKRLAVLNKVVSEDHKEAFITQYNANYLKTSESFDSEDNEFATPCYQDYIEVDSEGTNDGILVNHETNSNINSIKYYKTQWQNCYDEHNDIPFNITEESEDVLENKEEIIKADDNGTKDDIEIYIDNAEMSAVPKSVMEIVMNDQLVYMPIYSPVCENTEADIEGTEKTDTEMPTLQYPLDSVESDFLANGTTLSVQPFNASGGEFHITLTKQDGTIVVIPKEHPTYNTILQFYAKENLSDPLTETYIEHNHLGGEDENTSQEEQYTYQILKFDGEHLTPDQGDSQTNMFEMNGQLFTTDLEENCVTQPGLDNNKQNIEETNDVAVHENAASVGQDRNVFDYLGLPLNRFGATLNSESVQTDHLQEKDATVRKEVNDETAQHVNQGLFHSGENVYETLARYENELMKISNQNDITTVKLLENYRNLYNSEHINDNDSTIGLSCDKNRLSAGSSLVDENDGLEEINDIDEVQAYHKTKSDNQEISSDEIECGTEVYRDTNHKNQEEHEESDFGEDSKNADQTDNNKNKDIDNAYYQTENDTSQESKKEAILLNEVARETTVVKIKKEKNKKVECKTNKKRLLINKKEPTPTLKQDGLGPVDKVSRKVSEKVKQIKTIEKETKEWPNKVIEDALNDPLIRSVALGLRGSVKDTPDSKKGDKSKSNDEAADDQSNEEESDSEYDDTDKDENYEPDDETANADADDEFDLPDIDNTELEDDIYDDVNKINASLGKDLIKRSKAHRKPVSSLDTLRKVFQKKYDVQNAGFFIKSDQVPKSKRNELKEIASSSTSSSEDDKHLDWKPYSKPNKKSNKKYKQTPKTNRSHLKNKIENELDISKEQDHCIEVKNRSVKADVSSAPVEGNDKTLIKNQEDSEIDVCTVSEELQQHLHQNLEKVKKNLKEMEQQSNQINQSEIPSDGDIKGYLTTIKQEETKPQIKAHDASTKSPVKRKKKKKKMRYWDKTNDAVDEDQRQQREEAAAAEGFIQTQKKYYEILKHSLAQKQAELETPKKDTEVDKEELSIKVEAVPEGTPILGERVITKALSEAEKALEGTGSLSDGDEEVVIEDLANMCRYQLVEDEDHINLGGIAFFKNFTFPFVYVNGYKFTPLKDALSLFQPEHCVNQCTIPRNVFRKHRALMKSFSTWEQVYKFELIKLKKGPAIKTGDMLVKLDSLLSNLPDLVQEVRQQHTDTKLKRSQNCHMETYAGLMAKLRA